MQAKRLGLTVDEFRKKTVSDWWLYGQSIIKNNAADEGTPVFFRYSIPTSNIFSISNSRFSAMIKSPIGVILTVSTCKLGKKAEMLQINYQFWLDY